MMGDDYHTIFIKEEPAYSLDGADVKQNEGQVNSCYQHVTAEKVIDSKLGDDFEARSTRREISYYKWVAFFLLIEALITYIPRQIWHRLTRSQGLPFDFTNLRRQEEWEDKKKFLVWHVKQMRGNREYWLWQYLSTELLAIAILISFFILTDVFLGGDFHIYGIDWLNFTDNSSVTNARSPMRERFPDLALCNVKYATYVGFLENYHCSCLLPVNNLNDKMFLFLYFWYCLLFGLALIQGLYMVILLTCKRARCLRLKLCAKFVPENVRERYINSHNLSDWFFICSLAPNMDPVIMAELVSQLVHNE